MAQPYYQKAKGDFFQNSSIRILEWIAANRQTFFSVTATVVVVILVAGFTFVNFRNLRQRAADQVFFARNVAAQGDFDNALKMYNEVLDRYSRTPAAAMALFGKADILYAQRKFPESIDFYKQALQKNSLKIVKPMILSSLAAAQENAGQYNEAITTYKQFFTEFPEHFYAPKMYESLARCYELTSNVEAAKATYEKIITLYPNTAWVNIARLRYQVLSPAPFQDSSAAQENKAK